MRRATQGKAAILPGKNRNFARKNGSVPALGRKRIRIAFLERLV